MKRNKKIGLGLIGVLCISAILFVAGMGLSERPTGGQSTEKETEKEVQALEEQGVDRIQGFALAKPMPQDALVEFYRNHPMNE